MRHDEAKMQVEIVSLLDIRFAVQFRDYLIDGKCPIYTARNEGRMSPRAGKRCNDMGRRKGVPDLFLPIPRGGWHGLYIELKTPKGTVKPHQRAWMEGLHKNGYMVAVCRSTVAAVDLVIDYMEGNKGKKDDKNQ